MRDVLLLVARQHPDVLEDPPPEAALTAFGESSLDFELRVWTSRHVRTPMVLRSDLYFRIFDAFRDYKIEIPYPQRDLHVRSLPASLLTLAQKRPDTVT